MKYKEKIKLLNIFLSLVIICSVFAVIFKVKINGLNNQILQLETELKEFKSIK
jgi:hypothetical protein